MLWHTDTDGNKSCTKMSICRSRQIILCQWHGYWLQISLLCLSKITHIIISQKYGANTSSDLMSDFEITEYINYINIKCLISGWTLSVNVLKHYRAGIIYLWIYSLKAINCRGLFTSSNLSTQVRWKENAYYTHIKKMLKMDSLISR